MLNNIKNRKESGFTIIEVLIVLAIAGLIMVVVFLAVPGLQRSGRNNSRKTDANNLASSISGVMSNNGGSFAAADLASAVSNTKLGFYTAANITVPGSITVTTDPGPSAILVYPGYACGTNPTSDPVVQNRSTAVEYAVETGGGDTRQCVSS